MTFEEKYAAQGRKLDELKAKLDASIDARKIAREKKLEEIAADIDALDAKIRRADMVKGQAFITASYTLGCALGNFCGGVLVEHCGVVTMLASGVAMAAAGTLVLFLTVDKTDRYTAAA